MSTSDTGHTGIVLNTAIGNAITPDTTPTAGSDKYVTSDGVKTYIDNKFNEINTLVNSKDSIINATTTDASRYYITGLGANNTSGSTETFTNTYGCPILVIRYTFHDQDIRKFTIEVSDDNFNNTVLTIACYRSDSEHDNFSGMYDGVTLTGIVPAGWKWRVYKATGYAGGSFSSGYHRAYKLK
jgi:hypothetical protein